MNRVNDGTKFSGSWIRLSIQMAYSSIPGVLPISFWAGSVLSCQSRMVETMLKTWIRVLSNPIHVCNCARVNDVSLVSIGVSAVRRHVLNVTWLRQGVCCKHRMARHPSSRSLDVSFARICLIAHLTKTLS